MTIYRMDTGRYIIARWDDRQAQYVGHAVPTPSQGYCYTFGRRLPALADLGVPTYATLASAKRAMARRYSEEA